MRHALSAACLAGAIALAAPGRGDAQSLLAWQPGDPPSAIQVIADDLLPSEAGPCAATPPYAARLCRFSALDETLAGPPDPAHAAARAVLRGRLAPFLHAPSNCPPAIGAPVQLYTHDDAIQTRQALLVALHGGRDFMPPGARRAASVLADQACPLRRSDTPPDQARLVAALGQDAAFSARSVLLTIDNRVDPFRWDAPINQVRHHEQPSFSLVLPVRPSWVAASAAILAAARAGRSTPRILLAYDLTLQLRDLRAAMGEYTATDMAGVDAAAGTDLFSTTLRDTARYIAAIGPDSAEAVHLARYVATRLLAPCVQVSLAVVFQQDAAHWRDAEFMLAGLNEAPSGTAAFSPVGDPRWAGYAVEGGDNGHAAWNRLRLDAFAPALIDRVAPGLRPVPRGAYAPLPDGPSVTHLHGVIDLVAYYRAALRARIFPGSGATWNGIPRSALHADGSLDAAEHHAIHSIGVVMEVHGPFTAGLRIDRLRLDVQPADPRPPGQRDASARR